MLSAFPIYLKTHHKHIDPSRNIARRMFGQSISNLCYTAKAAYSRKGIRYVVNGGMKHIIDIVHRYSYFCYYKIFRSQARFEFMGRNYNYFVHPYGSTWKNERAVEIPIVWDEVKKSIENNKKILEVGNVLSYRFRVNYDIVDKYDIKRGVINEDIIDFEPKCKFDLIVCISTLEHIGWDEAAKDTTKVLQAVEHMRGMVVPRGRMIITIPFGYNPELDSVLRSKKMQFKRQYYMKKIGKLEWKQVDYDELKEANYDFDIPSARGLMIAIEVA